MDLQRNSVISDISAQLQSSSSGSSDEKPEDWTYPHLHWIKQLYEEMCDQGFYEPHVSITHRSDRMKKSEPGQLTVKLDIVVRMTICCLAPTKTDFINALGFIQPPLKLDGFEEEGPGPTRSWYQMVADRLSQPCKHLGCNKNTSPELALVQKCFKEVPPVDLNPARPNPPYFLTDVYESVGCCAVNSEKILKGVLAHYGYSVAKDIFEFETKMAERMELRAVIELKRKEWKKAFSREMRLLLDLELMPQERSGVGSLVNEEAKYQ
jgi:hypothetical protein